MAITPSEIITRRRSELGLSQAQLAERIGRAASTVRRWESGEAMPPDSILPTLANALQVATRDLEVAFGAEAEPPEPPEPAADEVKIEEQPTVAAPAPMPGPAPAVERAGAATTAAVAAPPRPRRSPLQRARVVDPREGLSYIEDNRQRLRYWLRAALTIIVGFILLLVLMWAFGELRQALADVWDLFGEEAPAVTSPGTDF